MILSHCFLWKDTTRLVHAPTHSLGQSPTVTQNFPDGNRPSSSSLCSLSSLCFSSIASHYSSSRHEKRDLVGGEIPLISVPLFSSSSSSITKLLHRQDLRADQPNRGRRGRRLGRLGSRRQGERPALRLCRYRFFAPPILGARAGASEND